MTDYECVQCGDRIRPKIRDRIRIKLFKNILFFVCKECGKSPQVREFMKEKE